jgi:hypothetical protein
MERPVGALDIEIAGVDAGVVFWRVALTNGRNTGTLLTLSPAGAARATASTTARRTTFILVVYLLQSTSILAQR